MPTEIETQEAAIEAETGKEPGAGTEAETETEIGVEIVAAGMVVLAVAAVVAAGETETAETDAQGTTMDGRHGADQRRQQSHPTMKLQSHLTLKL
jgi:hypothetical protein